MDYPYIYHICCQDDPRGYRISFPPFSDHIRRGEQRPRGDKRNDRDLGFTEFSDTFFNAKPMRLTGKWWLILTNSG
jgi:hypothetical protein